MIRPVAAQRPGERKTLIVIAITAIMMIVEIVAGFVFGSMACHRKCRARNACLEHWNRSKVAGP
jgi:heme/copper-type cytochrome/quinol oxidase subunit 2